MFSQMFWSELIHLCQWSKRNPANYSVGQYGESSMQRSSKNWDMNWYETPIKQTKRQIRRTKSYGIIHQYPPSFQFRRLKRIGPENRCTMHSTAVKRMIPNGKVNTSWEMQQGRLLPDAKANARMLGIEADADMWHWMDVTSYWCVKATEQK